uniref:Calcium homeostasis modulator 3 n=1 Tax=Salmo trutta TaxID=8032 RepID=A0A673WSB6_SALTR
MERLKLVLQYFQSNSASYCFDFNCPCIPQYNKLYTLGVMFVPPLIFFFLGILVSRHTGIMMEEWLRPIGKRSKDHAIVKGVFKYMFFAMMHRALLAPMVWILVTLLDGKIFICAFSMSLMAKVPCKEDMVFRNITFRKAVSRYAHCYSQAIGWSILLFFILLGALGRLIKPCFDDHATNLQTRYWSNYLDIEQKPFDVTCALRFCPQVRGAVLRGHAGRRKEEERLHGITTQEQMDQLLQTWFQCKPELDVTRMAYRPRVCVTWEDHNGKTLYSDV